MSRERIGKERAAKHVELLRLKLVPDPSAMLLLDLWEELCSLYEEVGRLRAETTTWDDSTSLTIESNGWNIIGDADKRG